MADTNSTTPRLVLPGRFPVSRLLMNLTKPYFESTDLGGSAHLLYDLPLLPDRPEDPLGRYATICLTLHTRSRKARLRPQPHSELRPTCPTRTDGLKTTLTFDPRPAVRIPPILFKNNFILGCLRILGQVRPKQVSSAIVRTSVPAWTEATHYGSQEIEIRDPTDAALARSGPPSVHRQ